MRRFANRNRCWHRRPEFLRPIAITAAAICLVASAWASSHTAAHAAAEPAQETGFLNRRIELHGVTYRFQVYLPEEWRRDDRKLWPIILALHGRGERGSEGMWQTQIGLPQQVRDHPERWPFVIVMPQCPQPELLDRSANAGPGPGRARPGVGRVSRRPRAHLSHRPFAGRLRRLGAGAARSASLGGHRHRRQRRLLELRPGALAAGGHAARPSTRAPSAARPSGSSTARTTP